MGFHTYDIENAAAMNDPDRFRFCSVEELLGLFKPEGTIADLGSGTGFFTQHLAAHADRLIAIDIQPAMHEWFRREGLPTNVDLLTAPIGSLGLADDALDGAISTFTFHEFNSQSAIDELARTIRPGGQIAIVDWTATGPGAEGPPTDHRYSLAEATAAVADQPFTVEVASERDETFAMGLRRDA
ncbi:class I SAM-dependent methyltransferase [Halocatena halophila]|uniref:class I SAM-dependent methyltransferase n=1 Tax=Halocatena halophila TaxID=2814576 RepID=UPI002ED66BC7